LNFFLIKEWIVYFHKRNDEHALHSPFFYELYTKLIKHPPTHFDDRIEGLRTKFMQSEDIVEFNDYGAGSTVTKSRFRKISEIAKSSSSGKKFSSLLYSIIELYGFEHILELGTSLGLNAAYMGKSSHVKQCITFEGDSTVAQIAKDHLAHQSNTEVIVGNIDKTLPDFLKQCNNQLDLMYIDANHTFEATQKYVKWLLPHCHKRSMIIIDDIHWSKGMKQAWNSLKYLPLVTASMDIFDAGFLFLNPDLKDQHHILNF